MIKRLLAPSPAGLAVSFGLFVLRLWYGLPLAYLHGWSKLMRFSTLSATFLDPYGLGHPVSLALSIAAELGMSIALVLGFATRPAALVLIFNMMTALASRHDMRLTGQDGGELAYTYLGAFVALLLAGGGRFSLDSRLFGRR